MHQFIDNFVPSFLTNEEFKRYYPHQFIQGSFPQTIPIAKTSFLSTDCSSLSSLDGIISSNISEKDSPIEKNYVDQTNYRVKYKTEICKYWRERGFCEFGETCAFAHGYNEVREKVHVPTNYKTKKCKKFHENGYCPYGTRCQFLHMSNKKDIAKNNRIPSSKLENNQDFLKKVSEIWDKEAKKFFWFYQSSRRLDVFEEVSEKKAENQERRVVDIPDILFDLND